MSKLQQTLLPIKLEASQERLTSLAGLMVVEELGQAKRCLACLVFNETIVARRSMS